MGCIPEVIFMQGDFVAAVFASKLLEAIDDEQVALVISDMAPI